MKILKKITLFLIIITIVCITIYSGIYLYAWMNPKLTLNTANSYYFYDIDENLITGTDEWITIDNIDEDLIHATIAIEDRHFFSHQGFDFARIAKSMLNNIKSGSRNEGASTITQQYTRNLFLNFDKTWKRKIEEAWLTVRMETHYSKEEILEGYLNTINYGGVFGIENASKYYFGKSASDLTIAEASMLAGIPNYPGEYSPFVNLESAKKRQKVVLQSMQRDGYITEEEVEQYYNEELVYANKEDDKNLNSLKYYQDAVLEELKSIKSIPNSILQTGGLKIYTNLDMKAQEAIETTIKEQIGDSDIQTAVIVMNPNTGQVLGMIGGTDYTKSQFNRALSSNRSVGSTIKPFLYYAALENSFTASTNFTSEKTTFVFAENQTYSPTNFGDTYPNQSISLATAIAYSDNIFAVKTHLFLGEETLVDMMKRVGVSTPLNKIPSLALGSEPISLMEMTTAYAALANEGYKVSPYFITKVEDISGKVLYEHKEQKEAVLNKSLTFIMNELLSNTSNPKFINYSYPTAYNISYKFSRKYAIKTGTTDFDHLIFGYNKDVVVGSWAGYDDNRELQNGDTTRNKTIWVDIIEKYLEGHDDNWYTIPNNVVGIIADPVTGKPATESTKNGTILYYIKGTEPTKNNNYDDAIPTIKQED